MMIMIIVVVVVILYLGFKVTLVSSGQINQLQIFLYSYKGIHLFHRFQKIILLFSLVYIMSSIIVFVCLHSSAVGCAPGGLPLLCWPSQVHLSAMHFLVHHAACGAPPRQHPLQDGLDRAVWKTRSVCPSHCTSSCCLCVSFNFDPSNHYHFFILHHAAFNLDFYTEVMDLTYLLDHLAADPFFKKFHLLNTKLAEVIQDYSLVSFVPLNVQVL